MPFDPEATGIIPRLDLESVKETPPSGSADPKASPPPDPPEPEDDSAGDDEDASATMTFRIPTSAAVRIGGPPTLDEQAPTDEQAKDPASAEERRRPGQRRPRRAAPFPRPSGGGTDRPEAGPEADRSRWRGRGGDRHPAHPGGGHWRVHPGGSGVGHPRHRRAAEALKHAVPQGRRQATRSPASPDARPAHRTRDQAAA